ncbi:MAG TPA: S24/S26 family peptidase [Chloroflexia bacterium]|nr:S24/S26 family peptidase [Chloroflexia bacterium]
MPPARLRVPLAGRSMVPWLRPGDWIEVGPPPRRPRRGMVLICLRANGRLITHRVIACRGRGAAGQVCTKGDALPYPDGWWDARAIVGQVLRVERGARRVALDRGWYHWAGWGYSWVSPASRWVYPVLRRLRALIRAVPGPRRPAA